MSSDTEILKKAIAEEMEAIQAIIDKYQKKLNDLKKFLGYIEKKGI